VVTAFASLLGPALARRLGKLRTAVGRSCSRFPFLVTLGAESHLPLAVGAFLMRADAHAGGHAPAQRIHHGGAAARAARPRTSLMNLLWNVGWAVSATLAGLIIERFGYAVPF